VLRKIHSADGFPGVEDLLFDRRFRLFDAHPETHLAGQPGTLIARRHDAICRATRDGAVWIGQLQPVEEPQRSFKRPAVLALGALADGCRSFDDDPTDASASVRGAARSATRSAMRLAICISISTTAP
jgi:putative two-component system hydrogenase maturation factor HypX/HoxX